MIEPIPTVVSTTMCTSKKILLCISVLALFSGCILLQPSAKKLNARALSAHEQYDAIIVPGVPFNEPKWDATMQMRVLWAVHLYESGSAKKIIMSGGAVYSPYVEAKIMKLYAIQLGVPEQDIFVESRSQHSTENIWYSYQLAKSMGLKNVALATDPFQTRATYRFGRRRVKSLHYLPVIFDTLKTIPHTTPAINYKPLKLDTFTPITETQSFWYRFQGTIGKHINFDE